MLTLAVPVQYNTYSEIRNAVCNRPADVLVFDVQPNKIIATAPGEGGSPTAAWKAWTTASASELVRVLATAQPVGRERPPILFTSGVWSANNAKSRLDIVDTTALSFCAADCGLPCQDPPTFSRDGVPLCKSHAERKAELDGDRTTTADGPTWKFLRATRYDLVTVVAGRSDPSRVELWLVPATTTSTGGGATPLRFLLFGGKFDTVERVVSFHDKVCNRIHLPGDGSDRLCCLLKTLFK